MSKLLFFSRTSFKQFPLITNDPVNFWLTVDDKADMLALKVLGHFTNLVFINLLLEQDFKQHPTTKFNKTPSAKYILL